MNDGIRSKQLAGCGVVGEVSDCDGASAMVCVRMSRVGFDEMVRRLQAVPASYQKHSDRLFRDADGMMLALNAFAERAKISDGS